MDKSLEIIDESTDDSQDSFDQWLRDTGVYDDEDESDTEELPSDDSVVEEEQPEPEPEPEVEQVEEEQPDKPWLTQENALNAQRRRENEARRLMEQTPEVQLARQLASIYGTDVQTLLNQAQEAALQNQATQQNVPVEFLRQQQAQQQQIATLQEQLNMQNFQQWNNSVEQEMRDLQKEYPFITQDELMGAKQYLLGTLKNVDIPLRQAVNALYGDKIIENVRNASRNNALAAASGRGSKPNPSIPAGSNKETPTLSPEEKRMAANLGVSEDDYIKYRY